MKFGYVLNHYQNLSDNPEILENRTRNMENIGFDSVWITDHILLPRGTRLPKYETITEIISTIGYLAGRTDRIKLGLSTLVLPLREPILVAKQISTLYYFMRDRLLVSFGAGWAEQEFKLLDQNFSNRGERFDEQIELIKSLWRGKDHFKGSFYNYSNATMKPRAPGLGQLPIYIAGKSDAAIKRSIRHGHGWHPVNLSPDELSQKFKDFPELEPSKVVVRLDLEDEHVEDTIAPYKDLGIESLILDDRGDKQVFTEIIRYVRSFQEFQP